MPIDASIISGLRPAQIAQPADPFEQYGKSLTLKNLLLQNQQAQQGAQDDQATREAYQQAGGDSSRLRALLQGGGQYKQIQALDKFQLENEEKRTNIDKGKQDILTKAVAAHRDELANINDPQSMAQWVASAYKDPVLAPVVSKGGTLEQALARIPQDPQAFQQFKQQAALGATKFIEMNKPHVQTQDLGGTSQIISTPGLGGAPSVLSTTAKTLTPGEVQSGTETARHNKEQERDSWQHLETPDGVVAFNPRTKQTVPLMGPDGKPLQGGKGLNEAQGKAAGMAMRAQTSHDLITDLEAAGTKTPGLVKQGVAGVPIVGGALSMGVNALPTWAGGPSGSQQQVEQAQRDFVNAALRVESGASINESEFENARKQYFTQPGDSPAAIEQKRRNRETEIESLKMQAGPLAKKALAEAKIAADERRKKGPSVDVAKLSDDELRRELGIKK